MDETIAGCYRGTMKAKTKVRAGLSGEIAIDEDENIG
jgi:hypothetical protein